MCGIVGFTGHRQAAPVLLDGLAKLEYRGYDSAGLAVRCGDELAIRKDDEPATVLDRLKAYHEQTEPLVEFYRQRGKLVEVPDQGSIEATTAFLLKLLEA